MADATPLQGMPHSAAATGLVDLVVPAEEMPAKLIQHQKHLREVEDLKGEDGTRDDVLGQLPQISKLLRSRLGHDFTQYKEKTLVRRIQRRMQLLQVKTAPEYLKLLRRDGSEQRLLFHELLINVTQFFRDSAA
jgi:two-component system, chemotaxis family, CheB/CheR fusion protein